MFKSQELSFSVNGLFRVSNTCFMLYLKNCHSALIVNSRLLHASTLELSFSVNGIIRVSNNCFTSLIISQC